ncbi:MAG: TolC family protein [Treponema sp.]|jgi:outer membrane protein TolC|nr:TolC family protein [Treponema sp.]
MKRWRREGVSLRLSLLLQLAFLQTAFLQTAFVFGQEAAPARQISLEEAAALAVKNNLNLQSSTVNLDTKKRKQDTAWNVFIPSVDLRGTLGRQNVGTTASGFAPSGYFAPGENQAGQSGTVLGVAPYSMEIDPMWLIQGNLSLSLQLNVSAFEDMKNTRLDYESGLLSYAKAKAQLERDVRKAYYNILLLQENIKLKKESYTAAERQEATARANYRAGLAPELSLLQAQVAKENLKPEIDELENNYKMLLANFAMYLGMPYDTAFELEPLDISVDFIDMDIKNLVNQAANNKPDILEIKQQIRLLESTRKKTFYQIYTPTLSLSWNMDPTWRGDLFDNPTFESNMWKTQSSGMFSFTLAFRLNGFLPWGTEKQGLRDLDNGVKTANIGLAQAVQGSEMEVYNIVLSLRKAQASIEALQKTVNLAERSYRATEEAYGAGLQSLLDVQNARDQLNQARLGLLAQHYTYILGLIDLEYATGVPFGTLTGNE